MCLQFCGYYTWYNGRLSFLINGPGKTGFEDWPRAYQPTKRDDMLVGVTDVGKQVGLFESEFHARAQSMLNDLQYYGSVETSAFSNLGIRLDFNGYYKS